MSGIRAKPQYGFTIVELLIVIVVISILAAIAIVAYSGVRAMASDAAVESDLRNFASKVQEYRATEGHYPVGGSTNKAFNGLDHYSLVRSAYDTTIHNFVYCRGIVDGTDKFAVAAKSKSGEAYIYTQDGLQEYTNGWGSIASTCTKMGVASTSPSYSFSFGYNHGSQTWYNWTN